VKKFDRSIPDLKGRISPRPAVTRRDLLMGTVLASAGLICSAGNISRAFGAASNASGASRKLIRNATVVTLDTKLGTLSQADILIDGERIAAIAPKLTSSDAEIIDGTDSIAIPGMIDTHRHMWQGCLRQAFPDDALSDYFGHVLGALGPKYRPEDVYIGNLVSALSALDAGVTNILDYSHISNTPQHTDAAIAALKNSGIRAVYGFGPPELGETPLSADKRHRYPDDLKRLRKQYFSSDDQLLTLALAPDGPSFGPVEPAIAEWKAAREVGARIAVHVMGTETGPKLAVMNNLGLLNATTTYIHCTNLTEQAWALIARTGGSVSMASSIEMQMGHGTPAVLESLSHGLQPSLSVDVETSAPNDMFTQMRTVFALQRALIHKREADGEKNLPPLLGVEDVFKFATIAGAHANGLERKIGTLAVGKQADIVLLRKNRINVLPLSNPVGAIVLGMDTGNVDSVFVAGKALKRNGQLVGVDLPSIGRRAQASREYLFGGKALG
jgi:5-methylthioadenosine/S-adenosylhomocysteine deaminase